MFLPNTAYDVDLQIKLGEVSLFLRRNQEENKAKTFKLPKWLIEAMCSEMDRAYELGQAKARCEIKKALGV
jgi:hypothetical protein